MIIKYSYVFNDWLVLEGALTHREYQVFEHNEHSGNASLLHVYY